MDTLLRETVNAVVNSRFPEMSIEGRRQIENILIREEYPKGVIALNEGEVAHELVFLSAKECSGNIIIKRKRRYRTFLLRRMYPDVYRKSAEASTDKTNCRNIRACCSLHVSAGYAI